MKRIVRYALIILQIVFILVVVYQFENMENNADEIKIAAKIEYMSYGGFVNNSEIYVNYDINQISPDVWKITKSLPYNRLVYVTLEKNAEDIFEVKTVTKKKPKQIDSGEVIVKANYSNDDDKGQHYVYYGFESISDTNRFGTFKEDDQLIVTILLDEWGQQKIVNIEKQ